MNLLDKKCVPCEGGAEPLSERDAKAFLTHAPGWTLDKAAMISREFTFKDFVEAMKFVNRVAEIAESEGHHPNIHIFYNRIRLDLFTHAINGLSENDFIVAAKINALG